MKSKSDYYKRWAGSTATYYDRYDKSQRALFQATNPEHYPKSVQEFLLAYGQRQFLSDKTAGVTELTQDLKIMQKWDRLLSQGITHEKTKKPPKNYQAFEALVQAGQVEAAQALTEIDAELAAFVKGVFEAIKQEKAKMEQGQNES